MAHGLCVWAERGLRVLWLVCRGDVVVCVSGVWNVCVGGNAAVDGGLMWTRRTLGVVMVGDGGRWRVVFVGGRGAGGTWLGLVMWVCDLVV